MPREYRYFTVFRSSLLLPSYISSAEGAGSNAQEDGVYIVLPARWVQVYNLLSFAQVAVLAKSLSTGVEPDRSFPLEMWA